MHHPADIRRYTKRQAEQRAREILAKAIAAGYDPFPIAELARTIQLKCRKPAGEGTA